MSRFPKPDYGYADLQYFTALQPSFAKRLNRRQSRPKAFTYSATAHHALIIGSVRKSQMKPVIAMRKPDSFSTLGR